MLCTEAPDSYLSGAFFIGGDFCMDIFPLSEHIIAPLCKSSTQEQLARWICLPEVPPIHTYLTDRVGSCPSGTLCITEKQTQGKRRLGRACHPSQSKVVTAKQNNKKNTEHIRPIKKEKQPCQIEDASLGSKP